MLTILAPVGMEERSLAEKIIRTSWRVGRLEVKKLRKEVEQFRKAQEKTRDDLAHLSYLEGMDALRRAGTSDGIL